MRRCGCEGVNVSVYVCTKLGESRLGKVPANSSPEVLCSSP